ncbi:hypothetical protein MKW98_017159 [Papaver atlanticum]|uniref:RING-type E3 ubiquitin transferase n=1 Tax=Papaver atlanticum TaxID=357466 RepID=A0AAD4XAR9_9MAGN|nr:hypothetical protein MKW98_017159 [Papaver atlanticum]
MGASIIIFPLFLFSFLYFPNFIASAKNCRNNQCSKYEPVISYPSRIKGLQDKQFGFPGFDLTCDNMNRTVLEFPFSGRFFVNKINYDSTYNEIQLQDPDNCLARHFLDQINPSGTPFIAIRFKSYSFFNCSSNVSEPILSYSTSISCLSSSTHKVFATPQASRDSSWLSLKCSRIDTIKVPVNRLFGKFLISIGIAFTILFGSVMYCISRANSPTQDVSSRVVETTPLSVINTTGLSGSAMLSFPMVVIGKSGRLPNPEINTCAICLSEYKPKEILKIFPSCNHCFHADCIDVWLHLKSSCPVCRKFLVA